MGSCAGRRFGAIAVIALIAGAADSQAEDGRAAIPDFSKPWVLMNGTAFFRTPGDAGPGPIMQRGNTNTTMCPASPTPAIRS